MRILGRIWSAVFGCWHRDTSWVFSDEEGLYRRCLCCGARLPYRGVHFATIKTPKATKTKRRRRKTDQGVPSMFVTSASPMTRIPVKGGFILASSSPIKKNPVLVMENKRGPKTVTAQVVFDFAERAE